MSSDVERLLRAVPIESYIQRYLPLKKRGANLWAVCPFHAEKSASFSVSPEKGIFKCFGCGKGGNLLTFVQDYERVDFREALNILSEISGIPLEGRRKGSGKQEEYKNDLFKLNDAARELYQGVLASSEGREAAEYLEKRGISADSVKKFSLGYAPPKYQYLESKLVHGESRGSGESGQQVRDALLALGLLGQNDDNEVYNRFRDRLIFPIRNLKGQTIAFGGRLIRAKENAGKYINSPENPLYQKKATLYRLNEAKNTIREAGQAILVEGYLDVLGLTQAGIENAVAPLGTAFTEEQAQLLKRYTDKLLIFFDGDSAGVEASYKALQAARKFTLRTRVVTPTHAHKELDPFDISQKLDYTELLTLLDSARSEVAFILWYFFSFKYNVTVLEEKREAMAGFFEYLTGLEQHWERIDYLGEAASVLQVDKKVLEADFRRALQEKGSTPRYERPPAALEEEERPQKPSPLEMETLGLLLRYPAFWQKKVLLEELELTHKTIYLLFTFFRDRLRAGEFWSWERLSEVMSLLPPELSSALAEIIMRMDGVMENDQESAEGGALPEGFGAQNLEAEQSQKEEAYSQKLERLIFLHKKERINEKIEILQQRLSVSESLGEDDADELTQEITHSLAERRKIDEFLTKR